MPIFSTEDFLNMRTDERFDDKRTVLPEGDYEALIERIEAREGTSKKTGNVFHVMDVHWRLTESSYAPMREQVGLDRPPSVRQSLFLDMTESGGFATGPNRNVDLGALRKAVGQESPPWSPRDLIGAGPALIHVGTTETDRGQVNEVTRVARL